MLNHYCHPYIPSITVVGDALVTFCAHYWPLNMWPLDQPFDVHKTYSLSINQRSSWKAGYPVDQLDSKCGSMQNMYIHVYEVEIILQ